MPKGKVKTNRAKVRRWLQKQRKRRREVEKIKDAKENVLHESSQSEHCKFNTLPLIQPAAWKYFDSPAEEVGHNSNIT